MEPERAGTERTLTTRVLKADAPQALFAATVNMPLVLPARMEMDEPVEFPDQPKGKDQSYAVAPLTGVML